MVENNPHKISTMGQGGSLAAITDASDFPHTGLIKGLSLMARQNIVVKNNSNDFDITQSTANSGTVAVSAGTYLRDGKLYTAQYKTGTTAASFTFGSSELITTYDKGYHLVVVDKNNFILIRKPTVANKVPDYTSGDTIIAIVEYSSTTSSGARNIQFLTTDKTENSVSIAYAAGTGDNLVYTEALSIESSATGDVTIESKVQDKDIIIKGNDGGVSTTVATFDMSSKTLIVPENIYTNRMQLGYGSGPAKIQVYNAGDNMEMYAAGDSGGNVKIFELDAGTDGVEANRIATISGHLHVSQSLGVGVSPIANAKLTVEGVLALDEVSAPTNTADYGQLYANADNDLHYMDGAGTDTPLLKGGKHTIWVPSSAMTPTTSAGCSALTQVEMTAGRPELQVLDFAADADDHAQFTVAFPKSWNEGTVTFQPFWTVTGTNTGTAVWELTGLSASDSYVINTGYPAVAATGAKAHSGTSNDLNVSAESGALTITNASVDSVTFFRLNLKVAGSSQSGVVRLIGLKMFYDINAGNDE